MYKKGLFIATTTLIMSLAVVTPLLADDAMGCDIDFGVYQPQFKMLELEIKKNPKKVENYLNKAHIHMRFYQLDEAKTLFEQALQLTGDEVLKQYLEAAILYCDLNTKDAESKLDKILSQRPDDPNGYFLKGLVELQKGDQDKALESFEKVISIDQSHIEAMNQAGWIYLNNGDYDTAIKYFNEILYRNENYLSAIDGKGYALYQIGLNKEALPYINEVIILLPDNWGAWVTKGEIYYKDGKTYLADYCLKKAENINPDPLPVKVLRAKLYPEPIIKEEKSCDDTSSSNNEAPEN